MKKLSEENDKIDLQQKSFMHWIEEANSMRELADLKEDNINILKIINFPDTGLKEKKQMLVQYHHSAAMNTINALLASNAISIEQSEALLENISKLNVGELSSFYLENMQRSSNSNNELSKKLADNKASIRKLESRKNIDWYLCLACQSLGLFCGLLAVIKKINFPTLTCFPASPKA